MIIGMIMQFIGLSFAPQTVVAPLASVELISNMVCAIFFLKEKFHWRDVVATVVILAGTALVIVFGSRYESGIVMSTCEMTLSRIRCGSAESIVWPAGDDCIFDCDGSGDNCFAGHHDYCEACMTVVDRVNDSLGCAEVAETRNSQKGNA